MKSLKKTGKQLATPNVGFDASDLRQAVLVEHKNGDCSVRISTVHGTLRISASREDRVELRAITDALNNLMWKQAHRFITGLMERTTGEDQLKEAS